MLQFRHYEIQVPSMMGDGAAQGSAVEANGGFLQSIDSGETARNDATHFGW